MRRFPILPPAAAFFLLLFPPLLHAAPIPLARAHAHNDYEHTRPLLDALDQGFGSVEADIHLVDGQLLVAHDRSKVTAERSLEKLYLAPLQARVQANGGRVHPGLDGFMLLVDIKADAEAVWPVLRNILEKYRPMLTRFTDNGVTTNAVTVVLSGARPTGLVAAEKERLCGIDGRLPDLEAGRSRFLFPLISESWRPTFNWFVNGKLAEADQVKLRTLVAKAHANGQRIRFWGLNDDAATWAEMYESGVDLINTDRLSALAEFLRQKPAGQR